MGEALIDVATRTRLMTLSAVLEHGCASACNNNLPSNAPETRKRAVGTHQGETLDGGGGVRAQINLSAKGPGIIS